MLLKALDLLRRLGWGIINFIYNLIDTLFDVLKSLNASLFTSPKNRIYNPITINTPKSEKNTAALSLKNILRFRNTILFIVLFPFL